MDTNLWDQFYLERGRYYLVPHEAFNRVIKHLEHYELKKVLDLGCGSGRHVVALSEKGFKVTGIDWSPAAIDLAQKWLLSKKLPGHAYIADLHEELKFVQKSSFDSVWGISSLQYSNEEQFAKTIKEIHRILKTGGLFFGVFPTEESIIKELNDEQIFFEEKALKELLEKTFRILELSKDKDKNIVVIAQEK